MDTTRGCTDGRLGPLREPPRLLIELALESAPRVRIVAEHEGDEHRLGAWLETNPPLLDLIERALELQARRPAA